MKTKEIVLAKGSDSNKEITKAVVKLDSIMTSICKNQALDYGWTLLNASKKSGSNLLSLLGAKDKATGFCSLCKELSEIYASANATNGEAKQFVSASNTLLCGMISELKTHSFKGAMGRV